uniref:Uncharacterized protein n=1 Tax=Panagrolaimus davidi TaxID=227884 RepID=A0A914PLU3_9BILA
MSLKYNTTGLLFQQFSIPTPIMRYCSLTFKEYKYLTANIGHLTMGHVVVKDENDQVVPVEDLLACIPNCFHFDL